jgi:ankyrin repeat protein
MPIKRGMQEAKSMKLLKFACIAVAVALVSSPAIAQLGVNDSQDFIDAVQKRDGDKATQLIDAHPSLVDTRDSKGDTGLIIAIRGSDRDWTGFLLRKGADTNSHGANGDTPLIAAAKVGFDEAASWLLSLGAKVDDTNKSGETALIIAVQQRDADLVKTLLAAGADPDRTDAVAGYSARDYANRDSRARNIQKLINDKKPKVASTASK